MADNLKRLGKALLSALPVVVAVMVLYFAGIFTINGSEMIIFSISAVLVVIGMFLFNLGAETAMSKMGSIVGSTITKKAKLSYLVIIFFLFGLFITIAEPDLSVLASQVNINSIVLLVSIGTGVGIFCVIGAIRILLQKSLKMWLLAFYGMMFAIACLVPEKLLPLSFDSGGVTTGPITVPFILAIGVGLAATRGGKSSSEDSFGLLAFSSIGPIITVMILSIIIKDSAPYQAEAVESLDVWEAFKNVWLPRTVVDANGKSSLSLGTMLTVLISLAPIIVLFIIYDLIFIKLPLRKILRLLNGAGYVYVGLVLFMTAVDAGFMPVGKILGSQIADKSWVLILVGSFLGIGAALAEPAVHVLTTQIEDVSDGAVSKTSVLLTLVIGNGIAIAVSMLRVIFPSIDLLYILVPGYIFVFILSFAVPNMYTGIAFDSGGVISGPMNTTFILPFTVSACVALNGTEKVMTTAFGTVALVALMPLISIQLLGLIAEFRIHRRMLFARNRIREEFDDQIIHF